MSSGMVVGVLPISFTPMECGHCAAEHYWENQWGVFVIPRQHERPFLLSGTVRLLCKKCSGNSLTPFHGSWWEALKEAEKFKKNFLRALKQRKEKEFMEGYRRIVFECPPHILLVLPMEDNA